MKAVALLRAVNLPGKTLAMAELRAFAGAIGLDGASTLSQSGNLLFEAGRRGAAALEKLLETEAAQRLGLRTEFFVRTPPEWRGILEGNPFADEAEHDAAHVHVFVLKDAPAAADVAALQRAIIGRERVARGRKHVYVTYPDGSGRSRVTAAMLEKHLRSRGTARNWNTVRKLDELLNA